MAIRVGYLNYARIKATCYAVRVSILMYATAAVLRAMRFRESKPTPHVVFLLTIPRRFLCCNSSSFVRRWLSKWRLFCYYLFLISPSFGASRRLCLWHFKCIFTYICLPFRWLVDDPVIATCDGSDFGIMALEYRWAKNITLEGKLRVIIERNWGILVTCFK